MTSAPDAPTVRAFLSELAANNSRDWFQANKQRYEATLKAPALSLLNELAPMAATLAGGPITTKLFRAHRDVRFSKDKTPYTTHLHLGWMGPHGLGWYFGISPEYVTASAGIMTFTKPALDRWRSAVASEAGAALATALPAGGWRSDPPALKRVPAPYLPDHPRADLLRQKNCTVWRDDLGADYAADPHQALTATFARMKPVTDWLAHHVT